MAARSAGLLLAALLVCACVPSGCSGSDSNSPATSAQAPAPADRDATHLRFVTLVDLSETWHNEEARPRNGRVLRTVAEATALAAEHGTNNPATFEYYMIGAGNLFAEPLCTAKYTLALIPGEDGFYERAPLLQYLNGLCLEGMLRTRPQQVTPISAAIVTAAEAMRDPPNRQPAGKRIIILSDMLEETGAPLPPHAPNDLAGYDVLVLFRALPQDQRDPTSLNQRLEAWRSALGERGARVYIRPDTGLSAADLALILREPLPAR